MADPNLEPTNTSGLGTSGTGDPALDALLAGGQTGGIAQVSADEVNQATKWWNDKNWLQGGTKPTSDATSAITAAFSRMPSDYIAGIQDKLYNSGWITGYSKGFGADEQTLSAVKQAISIAQYMNTSVANAIDLMAKNPEAFGGSRKRGGATSVGGEAEASSNAYVRALESTYFKAWGTPPPPGYIDSIARSGMNIYEFEAHEKSKPAYINSPQYQADRISLTNSLAKELGFMG